MLLILQASIIISVIISYIINPIVYIVSIILIYIYIINTENNTIYPTIKNDTSLINFKYMKYQYLKSKIWSKKRIKIKKRDNHQCQCCKNHKNLEVHHISYKDIPNENNKDLITLCCNCHQLLHDTYGYPKTYKDYMTKKYPLIHK